MTEASHHPPPAAIPACTSLIASLIRRSAATRCPALLFSATCNSARAFCSAFRALYICGCAATTHPPAKLTRPIVATAVIWVKRRLVNQDTCLCMFPSCARARLCRSGGDSSALAQLGVCQPLAQLRHL